MKGKSGGSTISGSNPADRFIMGLLRASADAIIVGAGTLHSVSAKSLWTPEDVYPVRSVYMRNTESTRSINQNIPCS